jgi:hypothetical protein
MSATKTMSSQAQTAKMIRAKLKAAYPQIPFRVTSTSFAGGNAVDIEWTDGPTTKAVDAIAGDHEYGRFDGMIDLYEYDNCRDDIPQAKYVQTRRNTSPAALAGIVAHLNAYWRWDLRIGADGWIDPASDTYIGNGHRSHEIHRTFHKLSLVCPSCGAPTLPLDAFCPACGAKIAAEA